jgi:hypothetical protein
LPQARLAAPLNGAEANFMEKQKMLDDYTSKIQKTVIWHLVKQISVNGISLKTPMVFVKDHACKTHPSSWTIHWGI